MKRLIVMLIVLGCCALPAPARADSGKLPRPFPTPLPDPTGYCTRNACTLVCVRHGDNGSDEEMSSASANYHSDKPHWMWFHGEEDDPKLGRWMGRHPLDTYYGQNFFSWVCAPNSVYFMQVMAR